MASSKSKRVLPKAVSAPKRDPPSSEEIADSLVDAFVKIATDKVADAEWSEGYQAGLADAMYEHQTNEENKVDRFVFVMAFSIGFMVCSFVFVLAHALHWWS